MNDKGAEGKVLGIKSHCISTSLTADRPTPLVTMKTTNKAKAKEKLFP
jgi:hypothetical protein